MSNISPFFSIIVPVYNVQKYINECLDSILCQSYKNLEIILVDDGSPDACPAICDDYAKRDNRIKGIHQSNQGLSQARNAGVRAATGDYLLFIDSDDKLSDDHALEWLAEFLEKTGATVTYCSGTTGFDQHGIIKKHGRNQSPQKPSTADEELLFTRDDILSYVRQNNFYMAAWSFVIRRDFFTEHSLFFYPGIYFEDMEWFPRLLLTQSDLRINVFSKSLYLYRDNPSSITHNFAQPHFESIIKILDLYKKQMMEPSATLFVKDFFNIVLYSMFIFFEPFCLSGAAFYKSNRPVILSLFRQNYKLLNPRNKILYLFILFSPKAFFVLRKIIKKMIRK